MSGDFVVDAGALHTGRPPVLLLGGLDLLRPLGYAGIPAIVATPHARDPALDSRYCRGRLRLPGADPCEAAIGTLLAAGERLERALGRRVPLFYGTDDHLSLISDAREALERYFLLLLNPPEVSRALLCKERFAAFARERGLPVPRTLAWEELGRAAGAVLVKPRLKTDWEDSAIRLRLLDGAKARVFASGRTVLANPLAMRLREQLSFQEYILGDDRQLWSYHGFAGEDGAPLAWFVGRKLRTFPPLTGMSSCLELARDDEVAALGREVAARVPLRGPFKIDFKRCAASGRLVLLEINARFNLWHRLGAASGVNLPRIAYDYLVHGARPARAPAYAVGRRWLCPRLDWRAYRAYAARGELGFGAWLASLAVAPLVYDTFSWTDPLPWIRLRARRAPARLRRELGQLATRLRRWRSTAF